MREREIILITLVNIKDTSPLAKSFGPVGADWQGEQLMLRITYPHLCISGRVNLAAAQA